MQGVLRVRKLWEAVEGFVDEDGTLPEREDWSAIQKQKDEDACNILLQGVEDEFVGDIKHEATARLKWRALEILTSIFLQWISPPFSASYLP